MCCVGNVDEPLYTLTVLQAGVDWQDTPKDVLILILKLIGFVVLFIDQVFLFFLAQTKMSWRSLLTSQYSR